MSDELQIGHRVWYTPENDRHDTGRIVASHDDGDFLVEYDSGERSWTAADDLERINTDE